MTAPRFNQANVALECVRALTRLQDRAFSARDVAAEVGAKFPDVPEPVRRLVARRVFRTFLEPLEPAEILGANLSESEAEDASRFLGSAMEAEANYLESFRETAKLIDFPPRPM